MTKIILTLVAVAATAATFNTTPAEAGRFGGFNTTAIVLDDARWQKARKSSVQRRAQARRAAAHRRAQRAAKAKAIARAKAAARARAAAKARATAAAKAQAIAQAKAQKVALADTVAQQRRTRNAYKETSVGYIPNSTLIMAPITRLGTRSDPQPSKTAREAPQSTTLGQCRRYIPSAAVTVAVPCSH